MDPVNVVLVHLMQISKLTRPDASGELVRDGRSGVATALVYLPRVTAVTEAFRRTAPGRTNPALITLQVGHLVGLTIAHEAGHAVGLPHTKTGVMNEKPSWSEVLDLRASRLAFRNAEAVRMRLALVPHPEVLTARAR
jgi:hypothetical protein